MSTLNVSNITDGTDTVRTSYVLNGSAKAWVNWDGTGTIAVRDSLNVSSLTDQTTGQYEVNFSSNMANTSYYVAGYGNASSATNNFSGSESLGLATSNSSMDGQLVGSCSLGSYVGGTGYADSKLAFLSTRGDLA